jgi:hypothetical protein
VAFESIIFILKTTFLAELREPRPARTSDHRVM